MQQGRYSACRSRPRRLYEIYLFLRNAEQPIDAFDMHVRRSTTWLTANDGWKCSRSAGRKVASRWQCHNATSVVDLRSGLSVPRILYKAVVASVPAAAGGGANDVLPRGLFLLAPVLYTSAVRLEMQNAVKRKKVQNVKSSITNWGVDCLTARARFGENDCRPAQSALCRSLHTWSTHSDNDCVSKRRIFGMRGLAFRLTSGEQFVPSAVESGPVPQNNLPQCALRLTCVRTTGGQVSAGAGASTRQVGTVARQRGRPKHGETASSDNPVRWWWWWRQQHARCQGD